MDSRLPSSAKAVSASSCEVENHASSRLGLLLLPFLKTLDGGGAIAVPVVLYGNRNFDDALIELRNILEEQGFHTIAGAAFIGEHSFSRILAAGRPDDADIEVAVEFGKNVAEKIASLCRKVGVE